jgi:hypothetical protein
MYIDQTISSFRLLPFNTQAVNRRSSRNTSVHLTRPDQIASAKCHTDSAATVKKQEWLDGNSSTNASLLYYVASSLPQVQLKTKRCNEWIIDNTAPGSFRHGSHLFKR